MHPASIRAAIVHLAVGEAMIYSGPIQAAWRKVGFFFLGEKVKKVFNRTVKWQGFLTALLINSE